jgi:serine protease Do
MIRRLAVAALALGLGAFLALPVSAQSLPAQGIRDAGLLKDYAGQIRQSFPPEFVRFMRELEVEFERRGQREAAETIENYLWGSAGTGFVYVAQDGANYIITGYQVIAHASGLSIHFEGPGGGISAYTGLSIVAADEELDIALLAFENGARPFTEGLPLLNRRLREGETVYSAGFPGGGAAAAWHFSEGTVSGTYVRIPGDDETMRTRGPYIQHSARTEQKNSGGLLLAAAPGSLTGYAVAGINGPVPQTAIPGDRVEDFVEKALGEGPGNGRIALEKRLLAFSRVTSFRLPYRYIAAYLSKDCVMENIAGIMPALNGASGTAIEDIVKAFIYSPARGVKLAVAWTIENSLRRGGDAIDIDVRSIETLDAEFYRTGFHVSGAPADALWVNEYGAWRIRNINMVTENADIADAGIEDSGGGESKLRTTYLYSFSVGYGYIFDNIHALTVDSTLHQWCLGFGVRIYYAGSSYLRGEGVLGLYFPIRIKNRVGLTPFTGAGIGFVRKEAPDPANSNPVHFDLCLSGQGGLRVTIAAVPGLFLQGMYQYNYEVLSGDKANAHTHTISLGYGF